MTEPTNPDTHKTTTGTVTYVSGTAISSTAGPCCQHGNSCPGKTQVTFTITPAVKADVYQTSFFSGDCL